MEAKKNKALIESVFFVFLCYVGLSVQLNCRNTRAGLLVHSAAVVGSMKLASKISHYCYPAQLSLK